MAVEISTRPKSVFRKTYLEGARKGLRVPVKEVLLAPPNPPLQLYDTSGPYTEPSFTPDLEKGLPPLRQTWIEARGDIEKHGMQRRGEPSPAVA
jgi:phosphomethylpyrimidine synthase